MDFARPVACSISDRRSEPISATYGRVSLTSCVPPGSSSERCRKVWRVPLPCGSNAFTRHRRPRTQAWRAFATDAACQKRCRSATARQRHLAAGPAGRCRALAGAKLKTLTPQASGPACALAIGADRVCLQPYFAASVLGRLVRSTSRLQAQPLAHAGSFARLPFIVPRPRRAAPHLCGPAAVFGNRGASAVTPKTMPARTSAPARG